MIPCRNLKLEILTPDPRLGYFIIDQDKIDGDKLIAPNYIQTPEGISIMDLPPATYHWSFWTESGASVGRMEWNEECDQPRTWAEVRDGDDCNAPPEPDPYPECEDGYCWRDIISTSTEITIDRGFDLNQSVVGRPEAGTLIADIADPSLTAIMASGLGIGQRVRLRVVDNGYKPKSTIIFEGVATAISSYNNAVDTPMVYLEAVDAIAQLNGVLLDQGRPPETYADRISYAVSTVPGLELSVADNTVNLNAMLEPLTALEMIVQSQDSEGSIVFMSKENKLYSSNRSWETTVYGDDTVRNIEKDPHYVFTNTIKGEIAPLGLEEEVCLSAFVQTSDTRQVINGITFYNYEIEEREDGDMTIMRELPQTYTFSDNNSSRLYGSADIRLTTRLDPTTLPAYAEYIFDEWATPKTKIDFIEWPADKFDNIDIPNTIELDIGDPVRVALTDPGIDGYVMVDEVQRIARLRHTITPQEWVIRADLI